MRKKENQRVGIKVYTLLHLKIILGSLLIKIIPVFDSHGVRKFENQSFKMCRDITIESNYFAIILFCKDPKTIILFFLQKNFDVEVRITRSHANDEGSFIYRMFG